MAPRETPDQLVDSATPTARAAATTAPFITGFELQPLRALPAPDPRDRILLAPDTSAVQPALGVLHPDSPLREYAGFIHRAFEPVAEDDNAAQDETDGFYDFVGQQVSKFRLPERATIEILPGEETSCIDAEGNIRANITSGNTRLAQIIIDSRTGNSMVVHDLEGQAYLTANNLNQERALRLLQQSERYNRMREVLRSRKTRNIGIAATIGATIFTSLPYISATAYEGAYPEQGVQQVEGYLIPPANMTVGALALAAAGAVSYGALTAMNKLARNKLKRFRNRARPKFEAAYGVLE